VRNLFRILTVVAAAVIAGGCLQKEEIHTLYLSADGSVVWWALEKDVRSDDEKPEVRRAEETAYLDSARKGDHDLARELASLGSTAVHTRVLRSTRPFVVMTTAGFTDVAVLLDRLLSESGTPGYARLVRDGSKTTLTLHVVLSGTSGADADLMKGLGDLELVLTEGRFVSGTGFTIADDGGSAIAHMIAGDDQASPGGVLDLMLTWEALPRGAR